MIGSMARQPIIIIGAGIAGLTLGRCLKQLGVPAILYEKASTSPRYNYGITLCSPAYKGLLVRLGIDETTFRRQTTVDGPNGIGMLAHSFLGESSSHTADEFLAHRGTLDTFLSQGLDIRYEHQLKKVRLGNNYVDLSFTNGKTIKSSLVVSADGVHSHIRISLLSHNHLKVLPCVAFNGKRSIDRNRFEAEYATHFKGSNSIKTRMKETLLQINISKIEEDKVDLTYTYSRLPYRYDDCLYKPNRPNASANDIPTEFFTEVASLGELEPPFANIFDVERLEYDRLLHWLMRCVLVGSADLEHLAAYGIVMIGDSAHAQPILGGQGANEAMTDGIELAELIIENEKSPTRAISQFYELSHQRWKDGVAASEARLSKMHHTHSDMAML